MIAGFIECVTPDGKGLLRVVIVDVLQASSVYRAVRVRDTKKARKLAPDQRAEAQPSGRLETKEAGAFKIVGKPWDPTERQE